MRVDMDGGPSTLVIAGRPDDPPLAAAWAAVVELGLPGVFADLSRDGVELSGSRLVVDGVELDRASLTGLYLRVHGAQDPVLAAGLRDWAELAPPSVRVVNRRTPSASNLSKPAQALVIRAAGFEVPTGLLTTDPEAAGAFVARHGKVIVKSTSAVRSIVRLVDPDEDFSRVEWCPTQFQAFVPGVEFRAHVVGEEVFAHRIESSAVDYRYGSSTLVPAELPDATGRRCVTLTRRLGLELSGLDLRRTPEGRWFCFEVNTSPVWSAYDEDGVIARALARHLSGHCPTESGTVTATHGPTAA
ncbi:ATP-grasp domain-containing protein [Tessaracoccus sp. Z1128]